MNRLSRVVSSVAGCLSVARSAISVVEARVASPLPSTSCALRYRWLTTTPATTDGAGEAAAAERMPLDKFAIAEVLSVNPHPAADRLVVCHVRVGAANDPHVVSPIPVITIVTGAPNVAAGDKVVVAQIGSWFVDAGAKNGRRKMKKAKLRGVPSHGMMCSLEELGLTTEKCDGIAVLSPFATAGPATWENLDAWIKT